MGNERKTENIVRRHFAKFSKVCHIEEQKSDNVKIAKLLKSASKKGSGHGAPEFIITLRDYPDFLIVIECKADIKKHESKDRNKYDEYAVDGVLLYSAFLSKEYDVLAIAVSGENLRECKVSHFLQLKKETVAVAQFGSKLLTIDDYLKGYLNNPQKVNQDYNGLIDFSKQLNEQLHLHRISEAKRSLLISGILIALESKPFRKSYLEYDRAEDLADALVTTVSTVLKKSNIQGRKLDNLRIQYSFIKTETALANEKYVLRDLIKDIDENINNFKKTHEYYDILGQLYIEFLRYANSDKGLGIVLTPPHLTELFAELACVTKDCIVYDNCTGTGGFLIAAMNKMVRSAKGDLNSIKKIKERQLIGVEYQSSIFALACSNMYIHQDGKTNIINGDCFDKDVIAEVRKFKPNIGFLNPPYKANKRKDIEELSFVLNNLECLETGGTCVAIVPMQAALAQKGRILELKKKLLQAHTLEAVLSMPNELFINSKVGVIACVMIFTAHKPHPKNKKTYFGYYKEDGFVKRKGKGRIDLFLKWPDIKEKWVSSFINRKEEPGFSVMQIVGANDEWCAEAYMQTDYSRLSIDEFIQTIKNYVYINELFLKPNESCTA